MSSVTALNISTVFAMVANKLSISVTLMCETMHFETVFRISNVFAMVESKWCISVTPMCEKMELLQESLFHSTYVFL